MTVVLEWLGRIYDFLKNNINKIYLIILYFKDRKIADQKRVIEVLERENKTTKENIKTKTEQNKKTKTTQDKIDALKKPIKKLSIIFLLFLMSCGTTKIVYDTQYLRPDLPSFRWCANEPLKDLPKNQNEYIFYSECALYYEEQIKIYEQFRVDFLEQPIEKTLKK